MLNLDTQINELITKIQKKLYLFFLSFLLKFGHWRTKKKDFNCKRNREL